jgi:hypothetical protein
MAAKKSRKDPAAVRLGRLRAQKLTPEQRSESASKAAQVRWSRAKKIKTPKKGW